MRHHGGVTYEATEAPSSPPPTLGDVAWTAGIAAVKATVIALAVDAFLMSPLDGHPRGSVGGENRIHASWTWP